MKQLLGGILEQDKESKVIIAYSYFSRLYLQATFRREVITIGYEKVMILHV